MSRSVRCRGRRQPLRDEALCALDHARHLWRRPACQAVWHILEQRQFDVSSRRAIQFCNLLDHALGHTLIGRTLD